MAIDLTIQSSEAPASGTSVRPSNVRRARIDATTLPSPRLPPRDQPRQPEPRLVIDRTVPAPPSYSLGDLMGSAVAPDRPPSETSSEMSAGARVLANRLESVLAPLIERRAQSLENKLLDLQGGLESSEIARQDLGIALREREIQLQREQRKTGKLEAKVVDVQNANLQLRVERDSMSKEASVALKEKAAVEAGAEKLREHLEVVYRDKQKLSDMTSMYHADLMIREQMKHRMESEMKVLTDTKDVAEKNSSVLERKVERLSDSVRKKESEVIAQVHELQVAQNEVEGTARQLHDTLKEKDAVTRHWEESVRAMRQRDSVIADMRLAVEGSEKDRKVLQESYSREKKERATLETSVRNLQNQNEQFAAELNREVGEKLAVAQEGIEHKNERQIAEKNHTLAQLEVYKLHRKLDTHEREISNLTHRTKLAEFHMRDAEQMASAAADEARLQKTLADIKVDKVVELADKEAAQAEEVTNNLRRQLSRLTLDHINTDKRSQTLESDLDELRLDRAKLQEAYNCLRQDAEALLNRTEALEFKAGQAERSSERNAVAVSKATKPLKAQVSQLTAALKEADAGRKADQWQWLRSQEDLLKANRKVSEALKAKEDAESTRQAESVLAGSLQAKISTLQDKAERAEVDRTDANCKLLRATKEAAALRDQLELHKAKLEEAQCVLEARELRAEETIRHLQDQIKTLRREVGGRLDERLEDAERISKLERKARTYEEKFKHKAKRAEEAEAMAYELSKKISTNEKEKAQLERTRDVMVKTYEQLVAKHADERILQIETMYKKGLRKSKLPQGAGAKRTTLPAIPSPRQASGARAGVRAISGDVGIAGSGVRPSEEGEDVMGIDGRHDSRAAEGSMSARNASDRDSRATAAKLRLREEELYSAHGKLAQLNTKVATLSHENVTLENRNEDLLAELTRLEKQMNSEIERRVEAEAALKKSQSSAKKGTRRGEFAESLCASLESQMLELAEKYDIALKIDYSYRPDSEPSLQMRQAFALLEAESSVGTSSYQETDEFSVGGGGKFSDDGSQSLRSAGRTGRAKRITFA